MDRSWRLRYRIWAVVAPLIAALALAALAAVALAARGPGTIAAPRDGSGTTAADRATGRTCGAGGVHQALGPLDPAPRMRLPTADGEMVVGGGQELGDSYVLIGHSSLSASSEVIWQADPFQLIAPGTDRNVHYVFLSYAPTPDGVAADIDELRARADGALQLLDESDRDYWRVRLHFVTANPLELEDPVAGLLLDWGPVLADVRAAWRSEDDELTGTHAIGFTDMGWARSLTETGPITAQLGLYGNLACAGDEPVEDIEGRVALIERGTCTFTEKAMSAFRHGALAVLLYTDDRPAIAMAGSCKPCPQVPVAMVDRQPGLDMRAQLEAHNAVTVTMAPLRIGADALAIDRQGRLRELGSIPWPFNDGPNDPVDSFYSIAKEAQYFGYEARLGAHMRADEASARVQVVPLLERVEASDPDWQGVRSYADVQLPDAATMATFDHMELELALACPGHRRANCPAWDYIVDLWLCDPYLLDRCDTLLGRWITPYAAEGHWLTDVTPLLALLARGGHQRFAFYTQQPYEVDLSLRLIDRASGATPRLAIDLGLNGGPFNQDYNKRSPISFVVPQWATRVELASYITGHGWGTDKENCAEFCNATHHFTVNGLPDHILDHPDLDADAPERASLLGCAEQVVDGVTPNQGGTWIYARGGWCPGLDVDPWVVDITGEVTPTAANRLVYRGLFRGADYVPEPADPPSDQGFDANIQMRSYMVFYAAQTRRLFLPATVNGSGL